MARLLVFLSCFFCYTKLLSQSFSSLKKVPLVKNSISGPLGSSVFFFKESDSLGIALPTYFKENVIKESIQYKYFDFDLNKKLFELYKKRKITLDILKNRLLIPLQDTALFISEMARPADDRIDLIYGKDKRGNAIIIADINNNNIFDDDLYFMPAFELSEKKLQINKDMLISNVSFVGPDSICKFSFDIKLNIKTTNVTSTSNDGKHLITFEYSENYFAKIFKDTSYLEIFIRPSAPLPFFGRKNYSLYITNSFSPEQHSKIRSMPYQLGDTIKFADYFYVASVSDNNWCDSIEILELTSNNNQYGFEIGQQIKFSGVTLDGKNLSQSDFEGYYTVIDFWGTWCRPCVKELPSIAKLEKKQGKLIPIKFLSILYDNEGRIPLAKKLLKQNGISWPQIFETNEYSSENSLIKDLRINSFPHYIVLSPNRQILFRTVSFQELSAYLTSIKK